MRSRNAGAGTYAKRPTRHFDEDACVAAGLNALDGWAANPLELIWTILAHHGQGPDVVEASDSAYGQSWRPNERRNPLAEVRRPDR